MANIKLSYFDLNGGRGEPARLALYIAGIPFEDHRISFAEWPTQKSAMPWGCVPVLEVDGQRVAQSNTINRYIGKLTGLYPEDRWQAALADEIMDSVEDISVRVIATFSIKDPQELKARRTAIAQGPLTLYLKQMQKMLEARGDYFADNRLTIADIKVFLWLRHIKTGKLDHISSDMPDTLAPLVSQHYERVRTYPKIVEYYERH